MALSETDLATQLENMTPTSSASEAGEAFAQAFADYMDSAVANGGAPVPIIPAAVQAQVSSMAAAIGFSSDAEPEDAADEMLAGIDVLWSAMVAAPSSFFSGATAITKPTYSGCSDDLADDMRANVSESRNLEDSMAALAATLHGATDNHGTATFPGPTVKTIT